jgi:hypothetical protein
MANGRIGKPGDVDCWAFQARKGEAFTFELRAAQLGSPLQGVLTVLDAGGKELARAEAAAGQADPSLRFTAPAEGTYCVRVAERFHTRGGPDFAYRLRMAGTEEPGFRLHLAADVLTLPRKGQAKLKVTAERRGGFKEPITLALDGLPAGVKATNTTLAANQSATEITFTAEPTAAIGGARLTVRGTAPVGGKAVTRTATLAAPRGMPEADSVLLAVALPVPFKVVGAYDMRWAARGSVHRRKYKIERNGFDGPLEISLADRQARHLQGVTGLPIVVPAGATEFEYAVQLPPWMEIGRTSRTCVMAVGVIKEGGHEYEVGFSSVNQNEQIVAVVETGRLGIEADKVSIVAVPGGSVTVPVKVARGKPLTGAVKVEMIVAEHVRGVRAEPIVIPADQAQGTITIRFAKDGLGPLNGPLILRATLEDKGGPVVAETKLEVVPEG